MMPKISVYLTCLLFMSSASLMPTTTQASASCATNKDQRLMCAKHPDGFIYLNKKGQAVCSNGDCITNANGLTLCSNKAGGAAWLDHQGFVICEGSCDAASALNCKLGVDASSKPVSP